MYKSIYPINISMIIYVLIFAVAVDRKCYESHDRIAGAIELQTQAIEKFTHQQSNAMNRHNACMDRVTNALRNHQALTEQNTKAVIACLERCTGGNRTKVRRCVKGNILRNKFTGKV